MISQPAIVEIEAGGSDEKRAVTPGGPADRERRPAAHPRRGQA